MLKLSDLFANCAWNVEYKMIEDWVSYAFVEDKDTLYIYFQGSHEPEDWYANFWFFPRAKKPYKDMEIPYKVHGGFLSAWKLVEDIVIEKIKEVKNPEAPSELQEFKWKHITVIGYSHGGALAGLCHECVWFWRPDLRDRGLIGYGFEAPRFYAGWTVDPVLKQRWAKFFVFRDGTDIVTHCPPWFFRFCHVGDIIKIKGDVNLVKERHLKCLKYHFPQVVYDGLVKFENEAIPTTSFPSHTVIDENHECVMEGAKDEKDTNNDR